MPHRAHVLAAALAVVSTGATAPITAAPATASRLTIANGAVSASFSSATGELVSLINIRSAAGPDDYLHPVPGGGTGSSRKAGHWSSASRPPLAPFCASQTPGGAGSWYIKTGGDVSIRSGWKGPPTDRCCRAKDASGGNCRWYSTEALCLADLAGWRTLCLSCSVDSNPVGCPMWADPPPPPPPPAAAGNGLFLAWTDAGPPPIALDPGFAGGTPAPDNGLPAGVPIAPWDCILTDHVISDGGASLSMVLVHPPTALRFHISAALPPGSGNGDTADGALNLSLSVELPPAVPVGDGVPGVQGGSLRPANVTVAFPYITGISLSGGGSSNRGINHFGTGLATDGESLPGWAASGGLYGWHTSQTWSSAWEPATGDGLSLVVKDLGVLNDTGRQRVIMRFPTATTDARTTACSAGGMYALAYPATAFGGSSWVTPAAPVQLLVHGGGWRAAAKHYGRWLRDIGVVSRPPPGWLDHVHSKDSAWVPDATTVAASKKSGQGLTSFENLYEEYYSRNTVDMIEFAMWWSGSDGASYGAYGADGVFLPRADLGGAAALQAGVRKIHSMRRRIQLYVSADIVHLNSSFFNASWPWQRWADWPSAAGPADPAADHDATTVCHAFEPWQRNVAQFTARIVELTGADGVRLDGLGGQSSRCDNPAHRHRHSGWENQGTAANVNIARVTRSAMDAIGAVGTAAILSSEGFQDVFHPHTQMSLVMFYPGKGIDAIRVARPELRAAAYSPDAGDIETALNGWMSSGQGKALRQTWPYASPCGAPALSGFPSTPCNYPAGGGRRTRWSELRPTLVDAILPGVLSDADPRAVDDPELVCRLHIGATWSVMLAARWNGSSPTAPTAVALPQLHGVTHAVEIDAYTLSVHTVAVDRTAPSLRVSVAGGFSAVLLPTASAPGLLDVSPSVIPTIDAQGTNSTTVALRLHAPWQSGRISRATGAVTVTVTAPGLNLSSREVTLPGVLTLSAAAHLLVDGSTSRPAFFMLTIEGEGVLPTRRWVEAV